MGELLEEFSYVVPGDIPNELRPAHNVQHAIDLALRAQRRNLSASRLNPTKHAELKR